MTSDFSDWETGVQNLKHLNSEWKCFFLQCQQVSQKISLEKWTHIYRKISAEKFSDDRLERTTYSTNKTLKRKYLPRNLYKNNFQKKPLPRNVVAAVQGCKAKHHACRAGGVEICLVSFCMWDNYELRTDFTCFWIHSGFVDRIKMWRMHSPRKLWPDRVPRHTNSAWKCMWGQLVLKPHDWTRRVLRRGSSLTSNKLGLKWTTDPSGENAEAGASFPDWNLHRASSIYYRSDAAMILESLLENMFGLFTRRASLVSC